MQNYRTLNVTVLTDVNAHYATFSLDRIVSYGVTPQKRYLDYILNNDVRGKKLLFKRSEIIQKGVSVKIQYKA